MSLDSMPEPAQFGMMPEIAKAICEVSKQVGTLGKDGDNKFASYKYVSVDKFFDHLGRLMAKEGLFVLTNEVLTSVERAEAVNPKSGEVKIKAWLFAKYEIFLCHESGSMWGPIKRDIRVEATGPQAYGAAASYAEKYFLRSLFKVPTGDKDIDAEAPEGLPANSAPARIERLSDVQVEELDTILVELGEEVDAGFKKHMNVQFLSEIAASQFDYAKKVLTKKKAQADAADGERLSIAQDRNAPKPMLGPKNVEAGK